MGSTQAGDVEAQRPGEVEVRKGSMQENVSDTVASGQQPDDILQSSGNVVNDHLEGSSSPGGRDPNDTEHILERQNKTMSAIRWPRPRDFAFFKLLGQLNIYQLQGKIEETQIELFESDLSSEAKEQCMVRLEDQLHRYTSAIQDFQYMKDLPPTFQGGWNFPGFIPEDPLRSHHQQVRLKEMVLQGDVLMKTSDTATPDTDPLRRWLRRAIPSTLKKVLPARILAMTHMILHRPRLMMVFVDRIARFLVAITGGLSLVVPMLIMRLNEDANKSLITTSAAVVLFSGLVSIGFSASNAETLGITAAYAAVLVVFVGTST